MTVELVGFRVGIVKPHRNACARNSCEGLQFVENIVCYFTCVCPVRCFNSKNHQNLLFFVHFHNIARNYPDAPGLGIVFYDCEGSANFCCWYGRDLGAFLNYFEGIFLNPHTHNTHAHIYTRALLQQAIFQDFAAYTVDWLRWRALHSTHARRYTQHRIVLSVRKRTDCEK